MNRLAAVLSVLFLFGCGDTPSQPTMDVQPEFSVTAKIIQITDLGPGTAEAINNRGQVVGHTTINGGSYPVLWQNGEAILIDPDGEVGRAMDINERGQIVGGALRNGFVGRNAFLWERGKVIDLGPGVATDISDSGQVVGFSTDPHLVWTWLKGVNTTLASLVMATGVNAHGQIVGQVEGPLPAVWSNGTVTTLGDFGGQQGKAWAINNRGQVVGRSWAEGSPHAFIWTEGEGMHALPELEAVSSDAFSINSRGQVVGGISGVSGSRAVMWEGDEVTILPTLSPGETSFAREINDRGQIVGTSGSRAVVWNLGG